MADDVVIRDRQHLGEGGLVMAIVTINKLTGKVEKAPELITRGFVEGDMALAKQAQEIVVRYA